MPRKKIANEAFPVGLFILLALILLVGGILWLRDFMLRPKFTFEVTYQHPTRLIAGNPIYYRGIQIGRIEKVALAPDLNSTNVTMGISVNHLRLSKTVRIYTREEVISGQRYIDIVPQDSHITNNQYIHNGDKLIGVEPPDVNKFLDQLGRIAERHDLEKLIHSTQGAMAGVTGASDQINGAGMEARQFLHNLHNTQRLANQAARQLTDTSQHVSAAAVKIHDLAGSVKTQLSGAVPKMVTAFQKVGENTNNAPQALAAVRQAATHADATLTSLDAQVIASDLIPNLTHALSGINRIVGDEKSVHTLSNLNETIARINCTTAQASHIMGQRFPGLKIFFGKPGGGYSCDQADYKSERSTGTSK